MVGSAPAVDVIPFSTVGRPVMGVVSGPGQCFTLYRLASVFLRGTLSVASLAPRRTRALAFGVGSPAFTAAAGW